MTRPALEPSEATSAPGAVSGTDGERDAVAALGRGERDRVLTFLMKTYGRPLYRYCHALVRDPAMAEDAHQTTFLQAYEDLGRFRGRSTLKTWLYGIARHRCLDALKSHRRRAWRLAPLGPTHEDEPAGPESRPEHHVAGRELADALHRCLESLGPSSRDALLLRFQAGVSYVEMETICGERAPTLQARVTRALPALRRCLESKGVRP